MRKFKHWVGTFEDGWWYTAHSWCTGNPQGSSRRDDLSSKRRAIEEARKLAQMAGSAFALIFKRVKGKRLSQEIHFTSTDN